MRQITFAVRMLRKTPFVTLVAVLSLGLGIGANTAIFSLFNQILMRPLPVTSPEALVNLGAPGPKSGSQSCNNSGDCDAVFSYPMYLDLSGAADVFTGIAAHRGFGANVGYRDDTRPTEGIQVSGNYFSVLGLQPALGRLIAPADTGTVGGAPVAVLSHDYWQTRFEGSPGILGQSLVVNGQSLTVVGVAPEGFDGTTRGTRAGIFVPITLRGQMEPPFDGFDDRRNYWAYLFARLAPGVTLEVARTAINGPYQAILRDVEAPLQSIAEEARRDAFLAREVAVEDGRRGQSYIFENAAVPLTILQLVTAVVLLIACANVANLLLARSASRAGEMAVRLSVGASRAQLVRQLLLESCLLAACGGLAGLLFFRWAIDLTTARLPFGTIDPGVASLGPAVLLFAGGLSLATGVLFGLFPALHATRPDLASTLKAQAGQPSGARSAARFRSALVAVQIALSMGLLTTAGLFTRSLLNVSRVDLGVEIDRLVTFRLDPQRNGYEPARAQQLFEDLMDRLAAAPGVTDVAAARVPLIANSNSSTSIFVEGFTPVGGERVSSNVNEVSPGYFRTVGMPLLAGRDFTDADVAGAPSVAVVNEAFARRFNLGPNPVGRRMKRGGGEGAFDIEIVGLVGDAAYSRVRDEVPPVFFTPYRQEARIGALAFYVRTAGQPEPFLESIRPAVASFDPNLPVQRVYTMVEQVSQNMSEDRLLSALSAAFAGLATLLAAIGLYGVLAFTVSQRTREFGLRLALGASPGAVQRLVLRQVLGLTLAGGLAGLALAMGVGYAARTQLFEMSSADPVALAASVAVLALVALAAGFFPSRRAARVDPMRALRWE